MAGCSAGLLEGRAVSESVESCGEGSHSRGGVAPGANACEGLARGGMSGLPDAHCTCCGCTRWRLPAGKALLGQDAYRSASCCVCLQALQQRNAATPMSWLSGAAQFCLQRTQ